jgi:hypothetical protein
MPYLLRHAKSPSLTIANGATDSGTLIFDHYSFGMFVIPAAFTGATVSFLVSADGTTFFPLRNAANSLISYTVTVGNAYPFPDEVGAAHSLKIRSASAEGAARTIVVSLKS